jgi:uncharacterized protein (TIGR02246 family)
MRYRLAIFTLFFALAATPLLPAQTNNSSVEKDTTAIRAVMDRQVADWNRGDIDAFATGYKNSPDILFIGSTVSHGYADMVAAYHKHYSTRAKMGTLSFSHLEVQPLDAHFATATGHYHLDLSVEEGSTADGYFMLVLEKTPEGWKIVRDDTTTLPKKQP